MTTFTEVQPTLENYWRAIILFGRNVASYKFALAKSLLEVVPGGETFLPLSELARPFARHIATHLKNADKQATSGSSQFLDVCRQFNKGEVTEERLAEATARLGFNDVIDAFHVVGRGEIGVRFFTDERKGIRLTDDFFRLTEQYQHRNLPHEVEARWRLVETAWKLKLPRNTLVVTYDSGAELLIAEDPQVGRTNITPCRHALNGYQKGKCFYCFADVSLVEGAADLTDVDHFFPHQLKGRRVVEAVDGVWNLVLACKACNRGAGGKFGQLPQVRYLDRLHRRNEYLIDSHHPLRETLLAQTGPTEQARHAFLQGTHDVAKQLLVQTWKPHDELEPAF
jgi:hypothetical protein